MNIAIINTFSHTKSTGKIAYSLYSHLCASHDCCLVYGEPAEEKLGDKNVFCNTTKFLKTINIYASYFFGNQGEHAFFETYKAIRFLEKKKIEVVYLLNIHGYFLNIGMLFRFFRKHNIKVIYLMLDEYALAGKCCFTLDCEKYKDVCRGCPNIRDYPKTVFFDRSRHLFLKKERLYEGISDITFVSIPFVIEKARGSRLLGKRRLVALEEGIDLDNIFYPRKKNEAFLNKYQIDNSKVLLLLVAPFSAKRKGCDYYIELAKRFSEDKDFLFVHVGFDGDTNILPPNYLPIPYIENQDELATFYSIADYFVCTSLAETVADTCLESLACGTPIIGFDCSGLSSSIREKNTILVQPKNIIDLERYVRLIKKKSKSVSESCRSYAEQHFDKKEYVSKLESLALGHGCGED